MTIYPTLKLFGGVKLHIVRDELLTETVDNFPTSRHRSKRIEKKLRKRLGQKRQQFALMVDQRMFDVACQKVFDRGEPQVCLKENALKGMAARINLGNI